MRLEMILQPKDFRRKAKKEKNKIFGRKEKTHEWMNDDLWRSGEAINLSQARTRTNNVDLSTAEQPSFSMTSQEQTYTARGSRWRLWWRWGRKGCPEAADSIRRRIRRTRGTRSSSTWSRERRRPRLCRSWGCPSRGPRSEAAAARRDRSCRWPRRGRTRPGSLPGSRFGRRRNRRRRISTSIGSSGRSRSPRKSFSSFVQFFLNNLVEGEKQKEWHQRTDDASFSPLSSSSFPRKQDGMRDNDDVDNNSGFNGDDDVDGFNTFSKTFLETAASSFHQKKNQRTRLNFWICDDRFQLGGSSTTFGLDPESHHPSKQPPAGAKQRTSQPPTARPTTGQPAITFQRFQKKRERERERSLLTFSFDEKLVKSSNEEEEETKERNRQKRNILRKIETIFHLSLSKKITRRWILNPKLWRRQTLFDLTKL